jgi:hypothetical protein
MVKMHNELHHLMLAHNTCNRKAVAEPLDHAQDLRKGSLLRTMDRSEGVIVDLHWVDVICVHEWSSRVALAPSLSWLLS